MTLLVLSQLTPSHWQGSESDQPGGEMAARSFVMTALSSAAESERRERREKRRRKALR